MTTPFSLAFVVFFRSSESFEQTLLENDELFVVENDNVAV